MKYSMTMGGILVSVFGTILVSQGFSESCSNEIVTQVPIIIGGAMAWVGRLRQGDVTFLGFKK